MTHFEEHNFTLLWKILNFRLGMFCNSESICTPPFKIPLTGVSFRIILGKVFSSEDYISIYLHRFESEYERENKDYEISLSVVDIGGLDAKTVTFEGNVEKFDYLGAKKFIKWNTLVREKHILLPDDVLTVKCVTSLPYVCKVDFDLVIEMSDILFDREKYVMQKLLNLPVFSSNFCPILHKWFQYLYPDESECIMSDDLRSITENTLLRRKNWKTGLPKQLACYSRLLKDNVSFMWYIKEFSQLNRNEKFFSPGFSCGLCDWKLLYYLNVNDYNTEIINIFICPMSLSYNSKKVVRCKISVMNMDGRIPLSYESIHVYDSNGQWRLPSFIPVEELQSNRKSYLSGDILRLYCTFEISENKYISDETWNTVESYGHETEEKYISRCVCLQRVEDLSALLRSGQYSDINIVCGQSIFLAHKCILSERSTVFRRLIKREKKRKKTNKMTIEITDLDGKTVKTLLQYIYSSYIINTDAFVKSVLRYDVETKRVVEFLH